MEQEKKKSLSEISHLFLSSVRDNATGGARPKRIPPGGERVAPRPAVPPVPHTAMSIDLTPEEYARVVAEGETKETLPERPPVGAVSALICSQFNGRQLERAREYARHLSANGDRVGLIQVDASECSVTCFETIRPDSMVAVEPAVASHAREMAEALEELAWDIDRWVVLLPSPRTTEARALLRKINHWTLLSTCDHDGVVSCYRAIKGLAETPRPRLTLALLNAPDKLEAGKVYRKIAGVCEQFLNWKMEAEPAVEPVELISEHLTLIFHPSRERAEMATGPHWEVVGDFLNLAAESEAEPTAGRKEKVSDREPFEAPEMTRSKLDCIPESPMVEPKIETRLAAEPVASSRFESSQVETPGSEPIQSEPIKSQNKSVLLADAGDDCDIADLPDGEVTELAVLRAVMSKSSSGLIECPIRPPTCPQATLAVNRDRRLVLLAVARKGLTELRAIALAYRWVIENRPLLSMALPQFAIDAHAMPSLKLLVDRADSGADLLLPMNENNNVTVQTYRKLRWAGKTGLLLEAA